MRIAQISATFPPYHGGTGNVCYCMARELSQRGHEVHAFSVDMRGVPPEEILEGIHVHRLHPLLHLGNGSFLPQLATDLRGFDLIHLHYPFLGGELAALAARLAHIPLVITYHNDVLLTGIMAGVEKALRWTVGRYALRSADRILFTTRDYAQASYTLPLLRGRESRIGAVPLGVDTHKFSPRQAPAALNERYKAAPGNCVALLVAGLDRAHYFKGVDVFLKALAMLPGNFIGIIVGDGDLRPSYEAAARKLKLNGRVYFTGHVSDEELPDFYRLADVTVLPSLTMGEAFGLVLLESMACGTPVIASRLPGVRTLVADGQDGFLIQPGDAHALMQRMIRLFKDSNLRQEFGQRGRKKVEAQYTWSSAVDKLEKVYRSLTHS